MKEALIAGAAVFLLSYLFVTILIKISRVIDRYKMKWIHLKEASI